MTRKLLASRYASGLRTILVPGLFLILLYISLDDLQRLVVSPVARERLITSAATMGQDFMTLLLGILVEAAPFVVLGVSISVLVQIFSFSDWLLARLPTNRAARSIALSFSGLAMPVCECGNVPVARSLMVKGLSTRDTLIFLLSAPSINFVTVLATLEAFNVQRSIAFVRVAATLVIANLTAFLVARFVPANKQLTPSFQASCEQGHQHRRPSLPLAAALFRQELWQITRLLIIGGSIAAATQILIPRQAIVSFASNAFLASLAMLLLAFIISICSSVDPFFALAYAHLFRTGPLITFLVAGPMVDIKMLAMLKSTFTTKTLVVLTMSIALSSLLLGMGLFYVY